MGWGSGGKEDFEKSYDDFFSWGKRKPEKINIKAEEKRTQSKHFIYGDESDNLANNHYQYLEFYHVPSNYSVAFKAFIDSFNDVYKSDWKSEKVYGRMDPIANFSRTSRKISVGFKVVAASIQEAEQNMRRISLLIRMLYPSYNKEGWAFEPNRSAPPFQLATIKGAPIFKVKFMNWISAPGEHRIGGDASDSGLMGYLDGLSFKPRIETGVFQNGLQIYAKEVSLNFNLNVIHETDLGWEDAIDEKTLNSEEIGDFKTFPYGFGKSEGLGFKIPQKGKRKEKFDNLRKATQATITGGSIK